MTDFSDDRLDQDAPTDAADAITPPVTFPAAADRSTPPPVAPPRRRGPLSLTTLLVLVAAIVLLRFNIGGIVEEIQYALTRGRQRAEADVAQTRLASLSDTSQAFQLVAQSVGPSVVHIDTLRERSVSGDDSGRLFPGPRSERTAGQGSGVIIDAEEGYILTNYHVIEDATTLDVKLSDGRSIHDARLVGYDKATDLAVLKIDADGLVSAPWGDSQALQVGDWVLAVGNPFGLDRSVTVGILSAKQRRHVVDNMRYQDFLQSDAAVNPGNSGGPLVNLKGEIIGINTAIVGKAYQGISFAIPSEIARKVYEDLKASGRVTRGWLGVRMAPLTTDQLQDLKIDHGVRIEQVVGVPAHTAGLRRGDILLAWNDEDISDSADLSLKVARTPVDSEVSLKVLRDGDELALTVKVGRQPAQLP